MTNAIQTDFNTDYMIVFIDGSRKAISKSEGEGILSASCGQAKMFTLRGEGYAFSSISKLITLREYYQQYPEKMPAPEPAPIPEFIPQKYTKARKIRQIESMIAGLNRAFEDRPMNGWTRTRIERLTAELEEVRNSKQEVFESKKADLSYMHN